MFPGLYSMHVYYEVLILSLRNDTSYMQMVYMPLYMYTPCLNLYVMHPQYIIFIPMLLMAV